MTVFMFLLSQKRHCGTLFFRVQSLYRAENEINTEHLDFTARCSRSPSRYPCEGEVQVVISMLISTGKLFDIQSEHLRCHFALFSSS